MLPNTYTQTSFPNGLATGIPGTLADNGLFDRITCWAMEAGLKYGTFAYVDYTQADKLGRPGIRKLRADGLQLTLSANITTGTLTGTLKQVKFDGTEVTTAISVPFNADHATTVQDLLDDLNAISGVTATSTDTPKRVIQIYAAADTQLSASSAFAMSGGTPTITPAALSSLAPNAVVGNDLLGERGLDNTVSLAVGDAIQTYRMARLYMDAETAMGGNDPIFARVVASSGTNQASGSVRNSAGTGTIAVAVSRARVSQPSDNADETFVCEFNFFGF
jgi:hypothetical protein